MTFAIENLRRIVDEEYVGVRLNTDKVKPVHIANGLFRSISGNTASTKLLHRFVFHQKASGEVPRGHDLDSLYQSMLDRDVLDESIDRDDVTEFRILLKHVVAADNGVFTGQMQSYSAGNSAFLSRDTVGQDAGEYAASWLATTRSPLHLQIRTALQDDGDVLSVLCKPLLDTDDSESYEPSTDITELRCYEKAMKGRTKHTLWKGMEDAASTLSKQLEHHPDKLLRLRMAVLFSSIVVFRHISLLEAYYDPSSGMPLPFVFDLAEPGRSPLRDAARQSYTRCTQSIARFYSFAFGEVLKRMYSAAELGRCQPPTYKEGVKKKRADEAAAELWKLKRQAAKDSQKKYRVYGEAVFDILALQSEADPIKFFRALGRRLGLLYPPQGVAVPWFRPRQDVVELLLLCSVEPDEVLDVRQLCQRLWERFGVLIGGGDDDEQILESHGILNWDRDSLRTNTREFCRSLSQLDFATELADGVTKVATKAHI